MNEQDCNIDIVRRHHDALNRGDIAAALTFIAEDVVNHGRPVGREGFAATLADIWTKFPDCRLVIDDVVASGDHVIVRCTYSGTHLGVQRRPFVDGGLLLGVPPTEKQFSVQHIHWYRLANGLIADHKANRDDVGMMVQLGLLHLPQPG